LKIIEVNDQGTVIPNPGGQADFANDWEHKIVGLEGGWFSGKTYIGARKLITIHLFNSYNSEGRLTFIPSVALSPTFPNAFDFQVPELLAACKEAGLSVRWKQSGTISGGKYSGPALTLPDLGTKTNPSVILIRSAQHPEAVTGWTVGASWGDEPARWKESRFDPRDDTLTQLMGRVRHPLARLLQMLFTYTNEGDGTKIYEEMHKTDKDIALYRAPTTENPVADKFRKMMEKQLTKDLQQQYLDGTAINVKGGRIYPSFSSANVNKDLDLVEGESLHLSVDFNISPGMHFEIGQLLREHEKDWLFTTIHEIYLPRLNVRDGIKRFGKLIEQLGGWQWSNLLVFGDASGRGEWSGTGESNILIMQNALNKLGIPYRIKIPRSNPLVIDRVNAVELCLVDPDEHIHWQCHPRCNRLIDDRKEMKWSETGGMDKRDKNCSHASDADDYRISYLKPICSLRTIQKGKHSVQVW